jgi:hypothetical protein
MIDFNKTYGGLDEDWGESVVECSGGGYAVVGGTSSFGNGEYDVWLIRTDASGNHLWNETYGSDLIDSGRAVVECSGGGFAIAGSTGFVGGPGLGNVWLIRTDANGNHLWDVAFGGPDWDGAYSVVECSGGGFAIAGSTISYAVSANDMWLIRTDANGNHLWNETYDHLSTEACYSVVECSGGGFALVGDTYGPSGWEAWLVRTDANGNVLWDETYGGADDDYGRWVVECSGGGFAIVGDTESWGAGRDDVWLIRTDANGNQLWDQTYGGSDWDIGFSLVECSGGGFAIAGGTHSFGAGDEDLWLLRTDHNGNELWNYPMGGALRDYGASVIEDSGGGFVVAGMTRSFGEGEQDVWLVRVTAGLTTSIPEGLIIVIVIVIVGVATFGVLGWWYRRRGGKLPRPD